MTERGREKLLGLGKNTARHHLLNRLQLAGGTNAGVGGEGDERVAPRRLRSTSMPPLVPASAGRTTGWRWVRRWYFAGNFTENRWALLYNEVEAEPLAASPRSVAPCIPFPFFFLLIKILVFETTPFVSKYKNIRSYN